MRNLIPRNTLTLTCLLRVNERRVSNVLQSLLVGASLFAKPVIKKIPTSVLWLNGH